MSTIKESIFLGYSVLIPVLLIGQLIGVQIRKISWTRLVDSINTTYLIGGLIFLVTILKQVFVGWYSGIQYESYVFIGVNGVPAHLLWGSYLLNLVIMPQLMWFHRVRKSFINSVVIVAVGLVTSLLIYLLATDKPANDTNTIDYLLKTGLFVGIVALIYMIKTKLIKYSEHPASPNHGR